MSPYGITIPLPGPLHSQQALYRELVDLGYTDVWSAESNGADGLTPLPHPTTSAGGSKIPADRTGQLTTVDSTVTV